MCHRGHTISYRNLERSYASAPLKPRHFTTMSWYLCPSTTANLSRARPTNTSLTLACLSSIFWNFCSRNLRTDLSTCSSSQRPISNKTTPRLYSHGSSGIAAGRSRALLVDRGVGISQMQTSPLPRPTFRSRR